MQPVNFPKIIVNVARAAAFFLRDHYKTLLRSETASFRASRGRTTKAYMEYTTRRRDEGGAEMTQTQQEREFCNGLLPCASVAFLLEKWYDSDQ